MDAIKSEKGFEHMKSKFESLQQAALDIQEANKLLSDTRSKSFMKNDKAK